MKSCDCRNLSLSVEVVQLCCSREDCDFQSLSSCLQGGVLLSGDASEAAGS